jgi:ribosomal protein S18 acetylase RimI-like enzyme
MTPDEIANLIAPLHAASWKTAYRGIMSDHFLDYVVDGERHTHWRKKVRALIAGDGEILLASLEEKPVGFLCIEGTRFDEVDAHGAYVNNLHVLPGTKGQGIGTALLEHGARWALKRGFSQMYLFVFEDNLEARAFYKSNGWHAVERIMSELPGGALAAELRLVKPISSQ